MTDNSLHIWSNARLAPRADPADVLENAAIVVRDGRIEWFGAEADMPAEFAEAVSHDLEGRIVTPGLVDCHTHLVYAGNRAEEFAMPFCWEPASRFSPTAGPTKDFSSASPLRRGCCGGS